MSGELLLLVRPYNRKVLSFNTKNLDCSHRTKVCPNISDLIYPYAIVACANTSYLSAGV